MALSSFNQLAHFEILGNFGWSKLK